MRFSSGFPSSARRVALLLKQSRQIFRVASVRLHEQSLEIAQRRPKANRLAVEAVMRSTSNDLWRCFLYIGAIFWGSSGRLVLHGFRSGSAKPWTIPADVGSRDRRIAWGPGESNRFETTRVDGTVVLLVATILFAISILLDGTPTRGFNGVAESGPIQLNAQALASLPEFPVALAV